jgi:hypothetical protein
MVGCGRNVVLKMLVQTRRLVKLGRGLHLYGWPSDTREAWDPPPVPSRGTESEWDTLGDSSPSGNDRLTRFESDDTLTALEAEGEGPHVKRSATSAFASLCPS